MPFVSKWQSWVAKNVGLTPKNAFESFVEVDREFVLMGIHKLVRLALVRASAPDSISRAGRTIPNRTALKPPARASVSSITIFQ
jgi:hypothetical protein